MTGSTWTNVKVDRFLLEAEHKRQLNGLLRVFPLTRSLEIINRQYNARGFPIQSIGLNFVLINWFRGANWLKKIEKKLRSIVD